MTDREDIDRLINKVDNLESNGCPRCGALTLNARGVCEVCELKEEVDKLKKELEDLRRS